MNKKEEKEIQEFNANPATTAMEKINLYLCGLGHFARKVMNETGADTFYTKTIIESETGEGNVSVKIHVKRV